LSGELVYLKIFLFAMTPIAELRGAIPYAINGHGVAWPAAYVIAVLGNLVPCFPLLTLLDPVSKWLSRYRVFDRFFTWLFARTRTRGRLIEKYEALGLALFVAIPLPVTGAWTGCAAAFVFGVRFKYAIIAVFCGLLISATIVTLASLGIEGLRVFISGIFVS
jgi:uncharacterized membrane protein